MTIHCDITVMMLDAVTGATEHTSDHSSGMLGGSTELQPVLHPSSLLLLSVVIYTVLIQPNSPYSCFLITLFSVFVV